MFDFLIKLLGGYTRADLDRERSKIRSGVQRKAFGMAINAVDSARTAELGTIRESVHFHGVASKAVDSFIDSLMYHLRAEFAIDGYESGVGFPDFFREQEDGPIHTSEISGTILGPFNVGTRIPDGAVSVSQIEDGTIDTALPSSPIHTSKLSAVVTSSQIQFGNIDPIYVGPDPADDASLPSNVAAVVYKDDLVESIEYDGELPANA